MKCVRNKFQNFSKSTEWL